MVVERRTKQRARYLSESSIIWATRSRPSTMVATHANNIAIKITIGFGLCFGMGLAILLMMSESLVYCPIPFWKSNTASNPVIIHTNPSAATTTPIPERSVVAERLHNKTRILCWILTGPANHQTKAQHIRNTWGSRCNKLLFMTSQQDDRLNGSVGLPVAEGRTNLWAKTKEAFRYVHKHHRHDADWFLKADDDTFVVMENLRLLLAPYSPEIPIYFGHKFGVSSAPWAGYMSGGAGYVMSRAALDRLMMGLEFGHLCRQQPDKSEDLEMGKCMVHVGVLAGDSRDDYGRERFMPLSLATHLTPKHTPEWYPKYVYYTQKVIGKDSASPNSISFHYVKPRWQYMMDYMLYTVRLFGRSQTVRIVEDPIRSQDEILEDLREKEKQRQPHPLSTTTKRPIKQQK